MTRPLSAAAQLVSSAATSLNQVAATFNKADFPPGSVNLDYGGGRYDKATELLASKGAANLVYDPFNRSLAHNLRVRLKIARAGGADSCTANNLLNVIDDDAAMEHAVAQCANGLKPDGKAWFLIHEGDRSGQGRATPRGWQRNSPAADYEPVISRHFESVRRRGNLFEASGPRPGAAPSLFSPESVQADIDAALKARGVMGRSKLGAGKSIGGCLYLAAECMDLLPAEPLAKALIALRASAPADFEFRVVKHDPAAGSFSFIASPDWDSAPEPRVGDAWKIASDGSAKLTRAKSDPQIYHHKWCFSDAARASFDAAESQIRSVEWSFYPCDKSRIGTSSYWDATVAGPIRSGAAPDASAPAPKRKAKAAA